MADLDTLDTLFVVFAFLFQLILIAHFALRRWAFDTAMRYGAFVYSLGVPALALSVVQMVAGKPWTLWVAGVLCAAWASFGYYVEYARRIDWRSGGHAGVFATYVILYLATVMFYWWPLAQLYRPLWWTYTFLFVIATVLNVASHRRPEKDKPLLV